MPKELKANILLVVDEEKFLKALSRRLQEHGLKVDTSTSEGDALKRVKNKDFDAIILDFVMPGADSIKTLRRIRSKNPELQIIMITGHSTVEKGVEAMKAGAVDFLDGPVDLNKLLDKIAEAQRRKILIIEKKHEKRIKEILRSKSWD